MAWAIVAGAAISAAGSIYQGYAIKGANEVQKRGIDINIRQAEIEALAAANDKLDMLDMVNSEIVNETMAANTFADSSGSIQAIMNRNNKTVEREISLLDLNADAKKVEGIITKNALDFQSKNVVRAGYINAAGTLLSAFGTKSLLGSAKGLPAGTEKAFTAGEVVTVGKIAPTETFTMTNLDTGLTSVIR